MRKASTCHMPTCCCAAVVPLISGQAVPTGTRRMGAVNASTAAGSSNVSVAVVDTGVQLDHPDLNVVAGYNCMNDTQPPLDGYGHGTHCSGIIGARNNAAGVIGVAPGTRIVAVKVRWALSHVHHIAWSHLVTRAPHRLVTPGHTCTTSPGRLRM